MIANLARILVSIVTPIIPAFHVLPTRIGNYDHPPVLAFKASMIMAILSVLDAAILA